MRRYFLTGSDTGVGKTWIGCALARTARSLRQTVRVCKPVETGCDPRPCDAALLARAAGDERALAEICPVQLRAPISPHAAARLEGRTIAIDDLVGAVPEDGDLVLVEGAGGFLSPLNDDLLMADLAMRLGLPTIIVVSNALGAINRALLTIEAVRARRLPIAAVVLNTVVEGIDMASATHAEAIARFGGARVLGPCPNGASDLACATILGPLVEDD